MSASMRGRRPVFPFLLALLLFPPGAVAGQQWLVLERDEFTFIYPRPLSGLVPRLAVQAESALAFLETVFDYCPSEPITIVLRDARDTGGGRATSLPHNRVDLEVAPFDLDYEFTRFDQQYRWVLSHELVHVVIGDQAAQRERALRGLLGKVMPASPEPLTVPFALLTSPGRMTPIWHQEGVAVFMETWLNGGFGRVLGAFDEMFFRTLVAEDRPFMPRDALDFADDDSYLLGTSAYLYGARFIADLAQQHGVAALIAWLRVPSGETRIDFRAGFEHAFGLDLDRAWDAFEQRERAFQQNNLTRLAQAPFTPLASRAEPQGWVGQPYRVGSDVVFVRHGPDRLASVERLDLVRNRFETIADLPTPRLVEVAATAYDPTTQSFYFTTHNDRGYRDLKRLDLRTGQVRRLHRQVRLVSLAIDPTTRDLWGVAVQSGRALLVYSAYPYESPQPVTALLPGTLLGHLAVSPGGREMAATLHRPDGRRSLILIDLPASRERERLVFRTLSDVGSPEHPAWSGDGATLYWDAYTNGVSNLFRMRLPDGVTEPLSHVPSGLFRPLWLGPGKLFAFRFTAEGFEPVTLDERPAARLPAVAFRGQQVLARNPELKQWRLHPPQPEPQAKVLRGERTYCGICSLRLDGLIPTLNAAGGTPAAGFFAQYTDPLDQHRILLRAATTGRSGDLHLGLSYEYRDRVELLLEHTPAYFYDLLNQPPAARGGWRARTAYKHWWIYDRPTKLAQWFALDWEDRPVDPDEAFDGVIGSGRFLTAETRLAAASTRRSIGSVDDERGLLANFSLGLPYDLDSGASALRVATDVTWLRPVLHPHNILRVQLAGGDQSGSELNGAARFRVGGFGNQALEQGTVNRHREPESLPGVPYRSLVARRYLKVGLEKQSPPIHLRRRLGFAHYAEAVWGNLFVQTLALDDGEDSSTWHSAGMQLNLRLQHFYTLQSTLSSGLAHAWNNRGDRDHEVFLSWKLFR